jgi:hypothetical protein
MSHDRNHSPVGWYVASYLLRFTELSDRRKNDPEKRFLSWENTILIKADNLNDAYEKVVKLAKQHTAPYKGGEAEVDVRWVFEGLTELLPAYEEIEDGAEIMWAERTSK